MFIREGRVRWKSHRKRLKSLETAMRKYCRGDGFGLGITSANAGV